MKSRLPLLLPLIIGGFLAGLLLLLLPRDWAAGWSVWNHRHTLGPPNEPRFSPDAEPEEIKTEKEGIDFARAQQWADAAEKIMAMLKRRLEAEGTIKNEALLTFKSEQAYRDFLARAAAAGLKVKDQLDDFRTVRVGYEDLGALQRDLLANAAGYGEVGGNYYAYLPETPDREARAAQNEVGFGSRMLDFLGVTGDHSQWGRGVTIAVLDSGVGTDTTFGTNRVRYLDVGLGFLAEGDSHGTSVAALALGQAPDAMGIAPAAEGISIKITGADGTSDLFTMSKAIKMAVDSGAQIINISLGAYQNSSVLTTAIDYASSRGVAIVAPSGNDQAAAMTFPAADNRVVSVGAVDAVEQQATFSNSGTGLKMTAPGLDIYTAGLNGERISFSGTSGSSPIVAGAIAAMMSQNPGINATQAWQTLQQYSSDGGAPGADTSYGSGILNLGWAMNRSEPTRVDTAVSSHYYNSKTGQMEFVVQNRSGSTVSGLNLYITDSLGQSGWQIPPLDPGATSTVKVPVGQLALDRAANGISFRSQLVNPSGVSDVAPSNNQKASTVSK